MASWEELREGWVSIAASADAAWQSAYAAATQAWGDLIAEEPDAYASDAQGFLVLLDEWDQYLRAAQSLLPQLPEAERGAWSARLAVSRREWRYYGAGIYPHIAVEKGSFSPGVGGAQVFIGAAVVVVALAGIAWAVAYYNEAQSKRDWAFYSLEELAGRVKALDQGKQLQNYTGPTQPERSPPPTEPAATQNILGWVGAGMGLAALGGLGIYFATRS